MRDWINELEEDLKWREAELASLKVLVIETNKGSNRYTALLRAMWAMLYAHYEGFTKFAWDLYLEAIEAQGIYRKDCKDELAEFSLQKEFKTLRGNLASANVWHFCKTTFTTLLGQPLSFPIRLETESNLWPTVYKDNSKLVNLSCNMIDIHETKLKALVSRRNEIAHGQKMVISTLDEYQIYENAAILVMHELAIEIINSLESRSYLI